MRRLAPIALNQCAGLLFGLIGITLISKLAEPSVYGLYTLFLTLTQLGLLLTHSALINHASRYWQRERASPAGYTLYLWKRGWKSAWMLLPMLLAVSIGLSLYDQDLDWVKILPCLFISNVAFAFLHIANGILNSNDQRWRLCWLGLVASVSRAFLPVGVAWMFGVTFLALGVGFAMHGGAVLICLILLFQWARHAPAPPDQAVAGWERELKDYGRPFVLLGAGGWLLQSADRWIVAYFFGSEPAGIFGMANTISAIWPNLVSAGLLQLVFPGVFRQADAAQSGVDWRKLANKCDQWTVLFLAVTVAGTAILALISPWLVGWLIGTQYAPSMPLLLPTGLAVVTTQVNQFQYLILQGQHNSAGMVKVMMAIAGLKTAGSIVAAMISWEAMLGWLMASPVISLFLGRALIHGMALKPGT